MTCLLEEPQDYTSNLQQYLAMRVSKSNSLLRAEQGERADLMAQMNSALLTSRRSRLMFA